MAPRLAAQNTSKGAPREKTNRATPTGTRGKGTPPRPAATRRDAPPEEDMALYRALAPCRIGRYRETGEVFAHPRFTPCPAFLEETANPNAQAKPPRPKTATQQEKPPAGATLADLFPAG